MGIDITGLDAIIHSLKHVEKKNNLLTLGRQEILIPLNIINEIIRKHINDNLYNLNEKYCEKFFNYLGFENVDSIDNSSYEHANIIHDMNKPLTIKKKYDYIFDGGTIEHIFNFPMVMTNIINSLNVGGIFCSVTCNNNFSGHGMYQFSPEIFLSTLKPKYGMEIKEIFLSETDAECKSWINVNSYNGYRNETRFYTHRPVYIITIARKISDNYENLFDNPPAQYNYESVDWKK